MAPEKCFNRFDAVGGLHLGKEVGGVEFVVLIDQTCQDMTDLELPHPHGEQLVSEWRHYRCGSQSSLRRLSMMRASSST